MRRIFGGVVYAILMATVLDLAILFTGLFQVAQGQDVYFNPFWRAQAELVIGLLN